MKLKSFIPICIITAITTLILSCDQKEIDTNKLCKEFYQLNKGKSFEGLYDVLIAGSRVKAVYDESANQYDVFFPIIAVYDSKSKNYINIPVFKKGATLTEKDSVFKRCDQEVKAFLLDKFQVSKQELFASYINYIDKLYTQYYNITTPKWYSSKNVIVKGQPRLGKFITFILKTPKEICKCYFVRDTSSLNEYWLKHFNEINKIETHWYYEINDAKK